MLSKSHSVGGTSAYSATKKKKAPPRPPPPTATTTGIKGSQSYQSFKGQSQKQSSYGQRPSYSVDRDRTRSSGQGQDLIDFCTPPSSPEEQRRAKPPLSSTNSAMLKGKEVIKDFCYRVGASVFYFPSELKNSTASSRPTANPFSPPRPSAQAMLASPAKKNTTTNGHGLLQHQPTIIKKPVDPWSSVNSSQRFVGGSGSVRSSSGSSDWSDFSQPSQHLPQQPRYGNVGFSNANIQQVPLTWDDPPEQHREPTIKPIPVTQTVVVPTIIKPAIAVKPQPAPKPPTLKPVHTSTQSAVVSSTTTVDGAKCWERNVYDEPPDSDFDEHEHEDSFVSPPMPSEPPPPLPPDVDGDGAWTQVSTANVITDTYLHTKSLHASETDRAYAITLYDYLSDVEGDLPLQAGDVVYLMKKIDEAWLYGHCAGVEGMFPASYVNVVVELPEDGGNAVESQHQPVSVSSLPPPPSEKMFFADALYQFDAETEGDLSLRPGDMVKIYWRINDDWLYGEVAGSVGQFPATFVDPVPLDLPPLPTAS